MRVCNIPVLHIVRIYMILTFMMPQCTHFMYRWQLSRLCVFNKHCFLSKQPLYVLRYMYYLLSIILLRLSVR